MKRINCFDCVDHNIRDKTLGGNKPVGFFEKEYLAKLHFYKTPKTCAHWNPEYWVAMGYKRNWGDASVRDNPNIEIVRRYDQNDNTTDFVILAPKILRRPITLTGQGNCWGSY